MRDYAARYCKSWALIIGINEYQKEAPLSYACNDADAVADVLSKEFGFPTSQIRVLKDGAATKSAILGAYLDFRKTADDPDDRIVVFFGGHGVTIPGLRGPVGYLVPVDGSAGDPNTLIRWDELTRNAEIIEAKHILFVMDACYSGLAVKRAVSPGAGRFVADLLRRPARQVVTAGKSDQAVADGGGPTGSNSIFTGHLLEGLGGKAEDASGVLTANMLMSYVYQKVGQDPASDQTPEYGHFFGDGDFVFKTADGVDLTTALRADSIVESVAGPPSAEQPSTDTGTPQDFGSRNGYHDPSSPGFGRNDWTEKLIERRRSDQHPTEISRAFSWIALTMEPASYESQMIDIASLVDDPPSGPPGGAQPWEQFQLPSKSLTTIDSAVFFDSSHDDEDQWWHFLRIDQAGNVELADNLRSFSEWEGTRFFRYVQVIGMIWQFLYFTKRLYTGAGYLSGARFRVNLIGTKETILADFAYGSGDKNTKWREPFDPMFDPFSNLGKISCRDPNLQIEYQVVPAHVDEAKAKEIIMDVAAKLGLAFNHKSEPRCFNYKTEVFPWEQYLRGR